MAAVKVRYKGLSDVREISVKALADRGIKIDKDLVFNSGNAWAVLIDLNEELEAILRKEGTFTISKVDDEGQVKGEVVTATKADDTVDAGEVQNLDTGEKSKKK